MISKELFVEAISSIQKQKDYQSDKFKLWKKYGVDGYLNEPNNDDVFIKVLKVSLGECGGELEAIEKFCYDNNFGRGKGNDSFVDSYNVTHKINSAEELYDYLLQKHRW